MPCDRISTIVRAHVDSLTANHSRKGLETVFEAVVEPVGCEFICCSQKFIDIQV